MKKVIITEFFTTVSFSHFLTSSLFLSFKLPFIRKGKNVNEIEKALLKYLDKEKKEIISFYN
jgi:hypothetical protein